MRCVVSNRVGLECLRGARVSLTRFENAYKQNTGN